MNKIISPLIIIIILLAVAVFMRFYNLKATANFAYDEEMIAWRVKQVLVDKKPTLIGLKAGEFGIFTAPALIYVFSFVYWLFGMNPIGINISAAILGVATTIIFFIIGKKIFNKEIGIFAAFLYGESYFLSNYDRSWLLFSLPLTSLLIFYLFFLALKTGKKTFLFWTFFLTGFSFNLHITAIFFPIIMLIGVVVFRPKFKLKDYFQALLFLLVWLLPLFVFDLRHQFLISQGIQKLLFSSDSVNYFMKAKLLTFITLENITRIIFFQFPKYFLWLPLGMILWFVFNKAKGQITKISKKLIIIWIFVPTFLLIFYRKNVPEYYLILSIPAYIFLLAVFLEKIYKKMKFLLIGFLLVFLTMNINQRLRENIIPLGLQAKTQVVKTIIKDSGQEPFNVYYCAIMGLDNGFSYLFWYYKTNISSSEEKKQYSIMMPAEFGGFKPDLVCDQIGILRQKIPYARLIKIGEI